MLQCMRPYVAILIHAMNAYGYICILIDVAKLN